MSPSARVEFEKWYNSLPKDASFDVKKEYCKSDVDILHRSCLAFRKELLELQGIDPCQYVTIAGVCMAIYRANYMPKNSIAVVKNVARDSYNSVKAVRWLKCIEYKNSVEIKSAVRDGEQRIKVWMAIV